MDSSTTPPKSAGKQRRPRRSEPASSSGSPQVKNIYQSGSETASPAHSKQASRTNSPRRRAQTPNNKTNNKKSNTWNTSRSGGQAATQGYMSDRDAAAQLSSSGQVNESDSNHHSARRHRKTKSSHAAAPTPGSHVATSLDGAIATPARQAAYAGPTFHASPAPSALPIPKFFAKTAPTATASEKIPSMQARLEAEEQAASSDHAAASEETPPVRREQSPLDIFFNAHRAEKAKQANSSAMSPFQPSTQSPNMAPSHTPGTNSAGGSLKVRNFGTPASFAGKSPLQLSTSKQAFMMELDGVQDYDSEEAHSQKSTSSFQDRMNSIKTVPAQQPGFLDDDDDDKQRRAKSEALKKLLMHQHDRPHQRQDHRSSSLPGGRHVDIAETTPKRPAEEKRQQQQAYNHFAPPNYDRRPHTRAMDIDYSSQLSQQAQQGQGMVSSPLLQRLHASSGGGAGGKVPLSEANLAQQQRLSAARAADVKSMESDLRRILKLDGFERNE